MQTCVSIYHSWIVLASLCSETISNLTNAVIGLSNTWKKIPKNTQPRYCAQSQKETPILE